MEDSGEFKGEFMGNFGELGELRLNVDEMRQFFGPGMDVEQLKERIRSLRGFLASNGILSVENAQSFILCVMLMELFRALMVPMPDVKDKLEMFIRGLSQGNNMTAPDIGRFMRVLLVTTVENDEMLMKKDVRLFQVIEKQLLSMMQTADPNFIPDHNRLHIYGRVVGNYWQPETVEKLWELIVNMHAKITEFMFLQSRFRNNKLVEFLIVGAQFERIALDLMRKAQEETGMSKEELIEAGKAHMAGQGDPLRRGPSQDSGGVPSFGNESRAHRLHKQ